jgi:coenzyme F420-reducing hydrogenase delta subunit
VLPNQKAQGAIDVSACFGHNFPVAARVIRRIVSLQFDFQHVILNSSEIILVAPKSNHQAPVKWDRLR